MASLRIAGQTDVGRSRRDNQDTFISQPLWSANDALLVVIDGVGGYAGGAQAAELARESIVQYMATPTGDTLTMLREAVIFANNQIARQRCTRHVSERCAAHPNRNRYWLRGNPSGLRIPVRGSPICSKRTCSRFKQGSSDLAAPPCAG